MLQFTILLFSTSAFEALKRKVKNVHSDQYFLQFSKIFLALWLPSFISYHQHSPRHVPQNPTIAILVTLLISDPRIQQTGFA
jgi:hypothetical protein